MAVILFRELVEEFVSIYKDKYPDVTEQQIDNICESIFMFVRNEMSKPNVPNIQLKHVGKFKVEPYTIRWCLEQNKLRHQKFAVIDEETYKEREDNLKVMLEFIEKRAEYKNNNIFDLEDT